VVGRRQETVGAYPPERICRAGGNTPVGSVTVDKRYNVLVIR
jgi:hypothetical protein